MFMDPYGPRHVYALYGHFSILFSIFFLSYFSPKDFIIPHIINNHMTDFPVKTVADSSKHLDDMDVIEVN